MRLRIADLDTLRQLNITHIINISRDTCKPFENDGITYHQCYIADSVFKAAYIFISSMARLATFRVFAI
jgi:hypothetical protein